MIEQSDLAFKIFWKVIDNARRMSLLMIISIAIVLGINLINNYMIQKNINDILYISKINDQTLAVKAKSLLILQIEKDFLLNYDLKLLPKYKEAAIGTMDIIEAMKLNPYYSTIAEPATRLIENIQSLLQKFELVVNLTKKIGITEESGLQKTMRDSAQTVEKQLLKANQPAIYITLLNVRRAEKDFIMRQNQSYFQKWELGQKQLIDEIHAAKMEPKDKKDIELQIDHYTKAFRELTDVTFKQQAEVKSNIATYDEFTTILEQTYSVVSSFRSSEAKKMKNFLNMMNMIACSVSLALLLIVAAASAYTFWLIRKLRKLSKS